MTPLVSIITPTFNDYKYLKYTYESILKQTYTNWEWLITDDCSSDGTYEYIQGLCSKDSRIKIFRNETNSGAAVSRNCSIKNASGRFIAFLDADDLWVDNKLEVQIHYMLETNVALSYSDYDHVCENGIDLGYTRTVPSSLNYKELLKENVIGCLTAVYDSEQLGKVYMPLIRKRQDYGLWLKILRNGIVASKVPGVLAIYRVRNNSVSSNKLKLIQYNFELFHKHENMSFIKASYYLLGNIINKLTKNRVKK